MEAAILIYKTSVLFVTNHAVTGISSLQHLRGSLAGEISITISHGLVVGSFTEVARPKRSIRCYYYQIIDTNNGCIKYSFYARNIHD